MGGVIGWVIIVVSGVLALIVLGNVLSIIVK